MIYAYEYNLVMKITTERQAAFCYKNEIQFIKINIFINLSKLNIFHKI